VTILGVPCNRLKFLRLRDTAIPTSGSKFNSIVAEIEYIAREDAAQILCAPWLHDPHCDHRAVQLIARAAARSLSARLLSYPVWGWLLGDDTQLPNTPVEGWRLDIQRYRERKRRAIAAHASQYSDLIDDDPNGFRLPHELLSVIDLPYEVFLHTL
jgi:LmbE family N-acetylglucosaminyl deacetylase